MGECEAYLVKRFEFIQYSTIKLCKHCITVMHDALTHFASIMLYIRLCITYIANICISRPKSSVCFKKEKSLIITIIIKSAWRPCN